MEGKTFLRGLVDKTVASKLLWTIFLAIRLLTDHKWAPSSHRDRSLSCLFFILGLLLISGNVNPPHLLNFTKHSLPNTSAMLQTLIKGPLPSRFSDPNKLHSFGQLETSRLGFALLVRSPHPNPVAGHLNQTPSKPNPLPAACEPVPALPLLSLLSALTRLFLTTFLS